jgi:hypothetical protein
MAVIREVDASLVKPLESASIRRFTAGATIEAGEIVVMMADGYVDPANTGAWTGSAVLGVALQDVASGSRVDVVTFGPVLAFSGGTCGGLVYASDTAGEPSESVGTKDVLVGFMESATVMFVRPEFIDRS